MTITATVRNASETAIRTPFIEVLELSGGNVLTNAAREGARYAVLVEVERRSGERVAWSDYASEQGEILAELRRKLGF